MHRQHPYNLNYHYNIACQVCTFLLYTILRESVIKVGAKRIPEHDDAICPIETALGAIGGMWKVIIIRELMTGTKRYSELHRGIGNVTHKMLTQQLRELEADGVISRTVYPVVPPKVEYELTRLGRQLKPIMEAMQKWGEAVSRQRKENGVKAKRKAVV